MALERIALSNEEHGEGLVEGKDTGFRHEILSV